MFQCPSLNTYDHLYTIVLKKIIDKEAKFQFSQWENKNLKIKNVHLGPRHKKWMWITKMILKNDFFFPTWPCNWEVILSQKALNWLLLQHSFQDISKTKVSREPWCSAQGCLDQSYRDARRPKECLLWHAGTLLQWVLPKFSAKYQNSNVIYKMCS